MPMDELIERLIEEGYLKTSSVIAAFKRIKREDFTLDEMRSEAGVNAPLPIGFGQTISQPLTVAFILELLQAKKGMKVMDIVCGSGWTSCLLADIVGSQGEVFAIERIPELHEFGKNNSKKYQFTNLHFLCADGSRGLKNKAPFDRILVSAAAWKIPTQLKEQLAQNGRMVIPTAKQDLRLIEKTNNGVLHESVFPGFVFVPLIES